MRKLVEVGTPKLELRQFCGTCRSPVRDIYRSCAGVQSTQLRTNANDLLHKKLNVLVGRPVVREDRSNCKFSVQFCIRRHCESCFMQAVQ